MSHRARVGEGEGVVSKLLVILRVDVTQQSYLVRTLSKKGLTMSWLPSRAPSLSTCTIHVPSRRKKYCVGAIEVHDSLTKRGFPPLPPRTTHLCTAYLIISIFLHDTCTLMLDILAKGWTKPTSKKRVKEHRFPKTKKQQGTSRWSICKEPYAFPLFFAACPPINK